MWTIWKLWPEWKERGSWSGWSGDHPWPSKSTWHTLYGSFYSPEPSNYNSPSPISRWKFPTTLSAKVVGKGIQFPWPGVLLRSILVSKSLGNQIGQCDLFLNSNWSGLQVGQHDLISIQTCRATPQGIIWCRLYLHILLHRWDISN